MGSKAETVVAGLKITAMVLVKVAGLDVSLIGELPVSDTPKFVCGVVKKCWKVKEKCHCCTDPPRMLHDHSRTLTAFVPLPSTTH